MNGAFRLITVNRQPPGIYGRMTAGAVIDYTAIDVAVLVEEDAAEGGEP
jgi:hypothetical protein